MKEPFISIIIPTLNEEKYLPKLLNSIKEQDYKNYEIIVADANSTDKTIEIARSYGAIVIEGGKPAKGRNNGAKISNGEYLLFLDADVILPKDFLKKAISEFDKFYYEVATFKFKPISELKIDHLLFRLANILIERTRKVYPLAPGFCIICTRRIFRRIGGFDESLYLAEDHDFVRRASKISKFGIIRSTNVFVSVRRLEKEGRTNLVKKYFMVEVYRILKRKVDKEILEYEFGNFEKTNGKLNKLEEIVERIIKTLRR
ncbi:MAG: glycosyltransferase [candidate division WOR-3 bacterium]|jgi:glycosyltransferase involved in cell wall biosynthesis